MRTYLRRCPACRVYTLRDACPTCGTASSVVTPARFSPEDHYGAYRRKLKREREGGSDG